MMTPLYLSRMKMSPRSRAVARDLSDAQAMHRRIMSLFPDGDTTQGRPARSVLYRPEIDSRAGTVSVIIQSTTEPEWRFVSSETMPSYLLDGEAPEIKPIDHLIEAIAPGQSLWFRLRANPTKRVHVNHGDDKLAGKRVNLLGEEQRRDWLKRKLGDAGCELLACTIHAEPTQKGRRATMTVSHGAVVYDGVLGVASAETLRNAIRQGIGPGKAYGFGLLSVAPAGA